MEESVKVSSNNSSNIDLSPLLNKLEQINKNQSEVVKQQQKLVDEIIPTDEELKQQKEIDLKEQQQIEKEKQVEIEKEKELQDKVNKFITDYSSNVETEKQFNEELLKEVKILNENLNSVSFNTQVGNNYFYILILGLLLTFVSYYIYRMIRRFF